MSLPQLTKCVEGEEGVRDTSEALPSSEGKSTVFSLRWDEYRVNTLSTHSHFRVQS